MAAATQQSGSGTADRELSTSRVFDAPRDLVFAMWEGGHIERWWGPRGFTTTTFERQFRPGGVWRFVMHGPDGRDYPNRITFTEVEPGKRIVYTHGGGKDVEPVSFETTVTFEDAGPGKTRMTMRALFPSANQKQFVIKEYGADTGMVQTVERLGESVNMARASAGGAGVDELGECTRDFVIERVFKAPRDLVFKAWTEEARLKQWFGPRGFVLHTARNSLRPGGTFVYGMRAPDGSEMWGRWVYREIDPPQRLVFVNSFSDEHGGITRHPMHMEWPLELLTTVTFEERGDETVVNLHWRAINATPSERKTFDDNHPSMTQGWGGTMERLETYLPK